MPFFKVASNYTYAADSHIAEEGGTWCDSSPINLLLWLNENDSM